VQIRRILHLVVSSQKMYLHPGKIGQKIILLLGRIDQKILVILRLENVQNLKTGNRDF